MSASTYNFFLCLLAFCVFNVIDGNKSTKTRATAPNIILIMMDDLGFTDTSINGGAFETPNIAELATNGIKMNYHYANTLCSASRSSLLTGRYAWRTGIVKIVKPLTLQRVNEIIPFIPSVLKGSDAHYQTAMYGKYH